VRGLGSTTPLTTAEATALFAPLLIGRSDRPVVLAVSGGPDSTAMLGLYAEAMRETALPVPVVATVDHRLRPGSSDEAAGVGRFAGSLGIDHRCLVWADRARDSHLQEDARAARYRLLHTLVADIGASAVLTAHTLDDQAETVLMRLIRGSGPAGLQGILAERTFRGLTVLRPLLGVSKSRLVATCAGRGWPYVTDPANADPRYDRARLRVLLPLLAREGLTAERLARFARRMQRTQRALEQQADAVRRDVTVMVRGRRTYDAAALCREAEDIVLLVLRSLIDEVQEARQDWQPLRLQRLEALADRFSTEVRAGAPFSGTLGTVVLRVRRGLLTVTPAPPRRGSS